MSDDFRTPLDYIEEPERQGVIDMLQAMNRHMATLMQMADDLDNTDRVFATTQEIRSLIAANKLILIDLQNVHNNLIEFLVKYYKEKSQT